MTRLLFSAILVTMFLAFFRLGSTTLFDVDEAVFAQATKEMVTTGDFITPTYNGVNRFDKPIFFYWLMALSYKVFGINEFAARFPSALAGFFICMALYFLLRRDKGEKSAILSVMVFALSLFFIVYSHAAVTDMSLTLFITLSLFSFYLFVADKVPPDGKDLYIYGFYGFSAIAFLTKGLIGIVFPLGIALCYLLISREAGTIRKIFNLKGLCLFLIISVPWFAAELSINGKDFFNQFIIKHHFMRYTAPNSGHGGPFYYYIAVLLVGLFPWIVFLPAGIKNAIKGKDPLGLLALTWSVFIVVFFSCSTTKLPNYILPSVPAVVLLISSGLSVSDRWRTYGQLALSVLSLLAGAAFVIAPRYLTAKGIHETGWMLPAAVILFVICILGLAAAYRRRLFAGYLALLMLVFLSVLSFSALPLASRLLQGTLYNYSVYAGNALTAQEKIIAYNMNNPSIVFYSGHQLDTVNNEEELLGLLKGRQRAIVISKSRNAGLLMRNGLSVLQNDGKYILAEKQ